MTSLLKAQKKDWKLLKRSANVAIVSSANGAAVLDEWTRHELNVHVDVMLGQEAGTKAYCIEQMKKFGFDDTHVLMIGDAPGDLMQLKRMGFFIIQFLLVKKSSHGIVLEMKL